MPINYTILQVMDIVRNKLTLGKKEGIFLLVNGKQLLKPSALLLEIYENFQDNDGFLYLVFAKE